MAPSATVASTVLPLQMVAAEMPMPTFAPLDTLMPPARTASLDLSLAVTLTFAPLTSLAPLWPSSSLPTMLARVVAWLTSALIAPEMDFSVLSPDTAPEMDCTASLPL